MLSRFFLIVLCLMNFAFASQREKHVFISAQMMSIQGKNFLALHLRNEKGWHTYWKNPGDSGLPLKFEFKQNGTEVKLHEMEWPAPHRYLEEGDITTYGYEGANTFFFGIEESQIQSLLGKPVEIKITYLVCKDICIPGQNILEMTLGKDTANFKGHDENTDRKILKENFDLLPEMKDYPMEFYLTQGVEEKTLYLHYEIPKFDTDKMISGSNVTFPFPQAPFGFKKEETFFDTKSGTLFGKFMIEWDGDYQEPKVELPKDGKFLSPYHLRFLVTLKGEKPFIATFKATDFSVKGGKDLNDFFEGLKKGKGSGSPKVSLSGKEMNMPWYLLLAFLGGLILNIMPCVLPVISLKLFSLVVHADEASEKILKHNIFYTLGVLFTFALLGIVVMVLKNAGEQIGWGFQLQSPGFVFTMMVVLFILTLNLFGLFEFITPGGATLGNAQLKEGMSGDFLSGILATILATPCSAPFLGTALTFAFTTSTFNIFLIFFSVGIGLAFPFLLTGFFPRLIRGLPRPGKWMNHVKKFLGVTLLLTFLWLFDIFQSLVNSSFNLWIILFFGLIFVTFFAKFKMKKTIAIVAGILAVINLGYLTSIKAFEVSESNAENSFVSQEWEAWSPALAQELMKNKTPTFIDFTAKWCLTCKVNKRLVLDTDDFYDLAKKEGIKLLVADWTKRDDLITTFLQSHGIVGVPAYFMINRQGEMKSLGETISLGKIKENL